MHRLETVIWNETETRKEGEKVEYDWFTDRYYYCVCGYWMTDIERQANEFEDTEQYMQAFRVHLQNQRGE
jgi:predicted NAD-dependent protein-ADP-ribosyltransferase YbiA (DUF1768 family)